MLTTEQMVALCGAHLIKELADLRSFLPSFTEKDTNREGMALPCENPEGNHVKHIRMMTLYSHERYSHEEVEEVIEEIKPSLFSADASSSQHTGFMTSSFSSAHAYSANASLHTPNTSSPGWNCLTAAPTASTRPAMSTPRTLLMALRSTPSMKRPTIDVDVKRRKSSALTDAA